MFTAKAQGKQENLWQSVKSVFHLFFCVLKILKIRVQIYSSQSKFGDFGAFEEAAVGAHFGQLFVEFGFEDLPLNLVQRVTVTRGDAHDVAAFPFHEADELFHFEPAQAMTDHRFGGSNAGGKAVDGQAAITPERVLGHPRHTLEDSVETVFAGGLTHQIEFGGVKGLDEPGE
jgi:hypothetical protein